MTELRLELVTAANVADACRLAVKPEQERFVAPVAWSLAEAYVQPDVAWPRLVLRGDGVVGFVMGAFDPHNSLEFFRCGYGGSTSRPRAQGGGVGRFAVDAVLDEARRRGQDAATVRWEQGPGGPDGFYCRLGFVSTDEEFRGEVIGRIDLRS